MINTYNNSEVSQSRLLVLEVNIKDINNSSLPKIKYLVARSSKNDVSDLENIHLIDDEQQSKTIDYLSQVINMNFSQDIKRKAITKLIGLAKTGIELQEIHEKSNLDIFNELTKAHFLANNNFENNLSLKKYIQKILNSLLDQYLFEGKNINNFQADKLFLVAQSVMAIDNINSNSNQDYNDLYLLPETNWTDNFYDFVTKEAIDYDNFDNFKKNIDIFNSKLEVQLQNAITNNKEASAEAFKIIFNQNNLSLTDNEIESQLNIIAKSANS